MIGNNNQTVNRISVETELTLLFELKGLFTNKENVTIAALYKVADDLDFNVVNNGLTDFIRRLEVKGNLETHRSKVWHHLSDYPSELSKRIAKMKVNIERYHPEYAQYLREN